MRATFPNLSDIRRFERWTLWILSVGFCMGLTFGCWSTNEADAQSADPYAKVLDWNSQYNLSVRVGNFSVVNFILTTPAQDLYFQNSNLYNNHFAFAKDQIPAFHSLDRDHFDQVTLHKNSRNAFIGSVMQAYTAKNVIWGIQIFADNDLTVDDINQVVTALKAAITMAGPQDLFVIIPTVTQAAPLQSLASELSQIGIGLRTLSSFEENSSSTCYANGWAAGTLVATTAATVWSDFRGGRISPDDIILIDRIEEELPPVAGIISKSPAPYWSATAIRMLERNKPFNVVGNESTLKQFQEHIGQPVFFSNSQYCTPSIVGVSEGLTASRQNWFKTMQSEQVSQQPLLDLTVQDIRKVSNFGRTDAAAIGAKAANFADVSKAIGSSSASSTVVIPFAYFENFLATTVDGRTIRESINELAQRHRTSDLSMAQLEADARTIQELIRQTPIPSPLYEKIKARVQSQVATPTQSYKLRASPNFDLSNEATSFGIPPVLGGDFQKHETEDSFAVSLKTLWASLLNLSTLVNHLQYGIDISRTSMSIIVSPASGTVANGTIQVPSLLNLTIMAQNGEIPWLNSSMLQQPEILQLKWNGSEYSRETLQTSTLLPLGSLILSNARVNELRDVALKAFKTMQGSSGDQTVELDWEITEDQAPIQITEVRLVPISKKISALKDQPLFVFGGKNFNFKSCFGENASAGRILRSRMTIGMDIEAHSFSADGLNGSAIGNFTIAYSALPKDIFQFPSLAMVPGLTSQYKVTRENQMIDFETQREVIYQTAEWNARFDIPQQPSTVLWEIQNTSRDVASRLLKEPFTFINQWNGHDALGVSITIGKKPWDHKPQAEDVENLSLCPYSPEKGLTPLEGDQLQKTSIFTNHGGPEVAITYNIEDFAKHPMLKTYMAVPVSTTFTGILSQPFTINSWWASVYTAVHHNFTEEFLFDVERDESLPLSTLAELRSKNIRYLNLRRDDNQRPQTFILDAISADGQVRELAAFEQYDFPAGRSR